MQDTITLNTCLCDRAQNAGLTVDEATALLAGTTWGFKWAAIQDTATGNANGIPAISANDKRSLALADAWAAVNRLTYPGDRCAAWQRWALPTWREHGGGIGGMMMTAGHRPSAMPHVVDMTDRHVVAVDAVVTGLVNRLTNTQLVGGALVIAMSSASDLMFGFASKINGYQRNTGVFTLETAFPQNPSGDTLTLAFALPLDFRQALAIEACYRATNQHVNQYAQRSHQGVLAVEDVPGLGGTLRDVGERKNIASVDAWELIEPYVAKGCRIGRG